jgi:hypothetical protein
MPGSLFTTGGFVARFIRAAVAGTLATGLVGALLAATPVSATENARQTQEDELRGLMETAEHALSSRQQRMEDRVEVLAEAVPEDCFTLGGDTNVETLRMAGPNRYETAACVSFLTWWDHDDPDAPPWGKAQAVVLARGDLFPDALAGGPLAAYMEGPLLLTPPSSLRQAVLDEIERVLAPGGRIYLLGGPSSVSNDIRSLLDQKGYDTVRLAGSNRYETAIAIAEELPLTSNFFFATGQNFPDALSAGTAAAALSLGAKYDGNPDTRPFALLLTNDDQMPQQTFEFAIDRVLELEDWFFVTAGGWADRAAKSAFPPDTVDVTFAGSNRYETAAQIADVVFTDLNGVLVGDGVGLATGTNFPDALAANVLLALLAQPLLLTSPTQLSSATGAFLANHAGEGSVIFVFGGTSTVSNATVAQAHAAFSL